MRTAIDTNIFSALWSNEASASTVAHLLGESRRAGRLMICGPVYVELLAHPQAPAGFVDRFLSQTSVAVEFDLEERIWRETGGAFVEYAKRRRQSSGGQPKRLLADFLIGAHASVRADRLMTLDPARYEQAFPELRLMAI